MKLIKLLEEIDISKEDGIALRDLMKTYTVKDLRYALTGAQRQRELEEDSEYNLHDTH